MRVREQRAAGRRPGDDLGLLEQLARQDVEQILREPPDRRRIAEQLVRVQVDAAVKAVAVIEVPVLHQHFDVLQLLQRLPAQLVLVLRLTTCLIASVTRHCVAAPPTMVAATPPLRVQPSNGVFFDFERELRALIVTVMSGARMVMSAGAPSASVPPGRCMHARRIGRQQLDHPRQTLIRPVCTSRSNTSGTAVSRPTMPNGARSNSTIFSSAWCGAWSVAITSTRAVGEALEHRVAVGRLAQRRVHLQVGVVLDRRRRAPRRSA